MTSSDPGATAAGAATDTDELAAITAEAADLGLTGPWGPVRRVELGTALSALAWGSTPAQVVMLHGAALNAHTWDGTLARWGVPALALDMPGHGRSAWRQDGDYGPATIAPDVRTALEQARAAGLLVARPALVGQSVGGLTALALVGEGEPATRVVLVDILPLPPQAGEQVAQFLAGPETFPSREVIVERALAFGLGGTRPRVERAVRLNTRVAADGSVSWTHHLGLLAARGELTMRIDDEALWAVLRTADLPIDLLRGERGLVGPALLARLAAERPRARVVSLDAGHNVQEDAPVALADALADLFGSSPQR